MPSPSHHKEDQSATRGRRVACFEWARALGCVAIVALHVYTTLWESVGRASFGPARAFVEGSLSILLGRWAVPVFLMVTGALLLDPDKDVGWERLRRYIGRMLFVLATFGLAFCLIESVYDHRAFSIAVVGEAVWHLLTAQSWGHLWYVYALLGLYALTPVLRRLTALRDRRALELVLGVLYVVVLGGMTALHVAQHTLLLRVNLLPALFYYVLGWYVWEYLQLDARTVGLGVASVAALLVCQAFDHGEMALPQYCLVAPYGVLVFLLLRRFAVRPPEEVPVVAFLADRSFGVYVVHPLFLHVLVRVLDPLAFPPGLYELLAFAVTLAGSLVLVDVVRRTPGFAERV